MEHAPQHPKPHGLPSQRLEPTSNPQTHPQPAGHSEPNPFNDWLQEEAALQRSGDWFKAMAVDEMPSRNAWLARSDAMQAEMEKLNAVMGDAQAYEKKKSVDCFKAEVEKVQSAFKSIADRPQDTVESTSQTGHADQVEVQVAHEKTVAVVKSMAEELLQRIDTAWSGVEEAQARAEKVLAAGQQTRSEIMDTAPKLLQNLDADLKNGAEMLVKIATAKSMLLKQATALRKEIAAPAATEADPAQRQKALAEKFATMTLVQNVEAGIRKADGLQTELQRVQEERQMSRAFIVSEADRVQRIYDEFKQTIPEGSAFEEFKTMLKGGANQLHALIGELNKAAEIVPKEAPEMPQGDTEPLPTPEESAPETGQPAAEEGPPAPGIAPEPLPTPQESIPEPVQAVTEEVPPAPEIAAEPLPTPQEGIPEPVQAAAEDVPPAPPSASDPLPTPQESIPEPVQAAAEDVPPAPPSASDPLPTPQESIPEPVQAAAEEVPPAPPSASDPLPTPQESIPEPVQAAAEEVASAPPSAAEPLAIPEGTIQFAVEEGTTGVMGMEQAHVAALPEQVPVLVACEGFLLQPVAEPVDAMLIGVQTVDTAAVPV